ncbi:MAG: hypothetical protein ABIQ27_06855 [Flavobacterium sp.]|uniref:hypothetical protein n=1 Tax=Flavobacterium sp. TaxID=239 RepID=UPI003266998F
MKSFAILFLVFLFQHPVFAQQDSVRDLRQLTSLTIKGVVQNIEDDSILKKIIKIELIDKKTFLAKKKLAVGDYLTAKKAVKKVKGKIKLPLLKGALTLTDRHPLDESRENYEYLGCIDFLDVYVILGSYWEDLDYKFISRKSGKEVQSFSYFPYISAGKKNIISIYDYVYDNEAYFDLYKIVNKKPVSILGATFKNWIPATEKERMFWGDDGNFYVPILYSDNYLNKDGNYSTDYKYIRISML